MSLFVVSRSLCFSSASFSDSSSSSGPLKTDGFADKRPLLGVCKSTGSSGWVLMEAVKFRNKCTLELTVRQWIKAAALKNKVKLDDFQLLEKWRGTAPLWWSAKNPAYVEGVLSASRGKWKWVESCICKIPNKHYSNCSHQSAHHQPDMSCYSCNYNWLDLNL